MSEELEVRPLYMGAELAELCPKPRETRWDRVKFWFYNVARRPKVRSKQRELLKICDDIRDDLKREVLPFLWQVRLVCPVCRDNFVGLRAAQFTSIIKTILEKNSCENHPEPYQQFLEHHFGDFEKSDQVAAWINGFK